MDDYVVRLHRPAGNSEAVEETLRRRRSRHRLRTVVTLVILALLGFVFRETIVHWAHRAASTAEQPVYRLRGDNQLQKATIATTKVWRSENTYGVDLDTWKQYGPEVQWGKVVTAEPCSGGRGLVLMAKTATGDVSRLFIGPTQYSDLDYRAHCPDSLSDPSPWPLSN